MKKLILLLVFIISFSNSFSQDYELRITPFQKSKIVYADGTSEQGLLRLASSAFSPRFKKTEGDKERKIDYKFIDTIITNPGTENERVFQYLEHNYNKFKIFVELIYTDALSIYISLTDSDKLFYSDFDRQSIREMMAQARFELNSIFNHRHTHHRLKTSDTIDLPNGKRLILPLRYSYYYGLNHSVAIGSTPKLTYYLLKEGNSRLYKVERKKRFLKRAKDMLDDCPAVISELEQSKINLNDLPKFIEYYKALCLDEYPKQE